jgi:hypothetical protein
MTVTTYRSPRPAGSDGFAQLVRAEWTKFRSVRGWVIGMVAAVLLMLAVGLLGVQNGGGPAYQPPDYYPLAPWAGFAVLCGYAVVAMGLAVFLLRRRDA